MKTSNKFSLPYPKSSFGYSYISSLSAEYINKLLSLIEYIDKLFLSTIPHCNNNAQAPVTIAVAAELPLTLLMLSLPEDVVKILMPSVAISGLINPFVLNPFPDADTKLLFTPL